MNNPNQSTQRKVPHSNDQKLDNSDSYRNYIKFDTFAASQKEEIFRKLQNLKQIFLAPKRLIKVSLEDEASMLNSIQKEALNKSPP